MPQPVYRGLQQPVLLDVLGELVEGDLDGQRDAEAPCNLVPEPDAAPHGGQRVLLPPVALEQAPLDGTLRAAGEGKGNRFEDAVRRFCNPKASVPPCPWGPTRTQ